MADIKIKIGASVDSDLGNIFRPIRDEARRTRKQISDDQKAFDKAMYKASLAEARDHHKALTQLNQMAFKAKVQAERDAARQVNSIRMSASQKAHAIELQNIKASAQAQREAARNASREKIETMRLADREARRLSMDQDRNNRREGGLIGYLGGRQVVSNAGRTFSRIMGAGARVGGQIAGGLGVDFDISSMVRRNVERDKLARDIVNSAYQPGAAGPAGQRQDHNQLVNEMETIGKDVRIDPTAALQGAMKFVEVSGDLQTARETMRGLAMLSQATGSELNHVAEAAGNVSVQLGDVPDKGNKVMTVMRAVAGQGKLGAVELRDMAKQMAALAANASNFAGKPEDTIAMMGVLAQEARQHGSAKSASEAAFSVSSLVQTFSKNPRVAAMKAAGIKVFNEKGQINDIQGIITQMLVKTGGDRIKIGDMVKDARARRAVMGFENIYRNTDVGPRLKGESANDFKIRETTAKVAAVTNEFERLKRIAMSEAEIRQSATLAMESPAAKAQAFQNELDKTTKEIQARLLPTLEKMAPDLVRVAGAFGKMVEFAANNPMQAIFGSLALSVAKAGVGELIARAVGTSLTGGAGSLVGAAGGIGAGGAVGLGAFALQMGAATLAIGALGLAADQAQKLWSETHRETSFAPGTSKEEQERILKMTPDERRAEIAASMNVTALERAGHTTGQGSGFGPPTAAVAEMIDKQQLLTSSQLQAKFLGDILKAQLTTVEELRALGGENKNGGSGFGGGSPPPLFSGGTTDTTDPIGNTSSM